MTVLSLSGLTRQSLLTKSELFDECTVAFEVCAFIVAEHLAALTYNLEQSTFCVSVLWELLVVICELLDALCHDCNLYLYITCIGVLCAVLLYCSDVPTLDTISFLL